jgi:hypothetical protein
MCKTIILHITLYAAKNGRGKILFLKNGNYGSAEKYITKNFIICPSPNIIIGIKSWKVNWKD